MARADNQNRRIVFISKSTPGDDAFTLWLAPRLEAHGYEVFADILCLEAGERWRRKLTNVLQDNAAKMLLCCSDETLSKPGVLEEIEIAEELKRSLPDEKFIIPLRLRPHRKLFGIGSLQWIDFTHGWAEGLAALLRELAKQEVPKRNDIAINPAWAAYQRRRLLDVESSPETLTSNWLRVLHMPDRVHFLTPRGAASSAALDRALSASAYPFVRHSEGIITFARPSDLLPISDRIGGFTTAASIDCADMHQSGWPAIKIVQPDARRILVSLMHQSWEATCQRSGFFKYEYSGGSAAITSSNQVGIGKRVAWGRPGARRNSMLRNCARGKIWEYGVSAQASLFPFPHYKLKARVLFSEANGENSPRVIIDGKAQNRLRRAVCSAWRNKAWHGRLMAFLELLAGDSPYITMRVAEDEHITLDAMPIQVVSPITARQTNYMDEDAEETDPSLLIGPYQEDDE